MSKWTPKDMEWFLADMIQELRVAGEQDSTVWINTLLIRANSIEEAYEKALVQGKQYESTWTNTDGAQVTSRFRGLRNLLLIYEKLEDGSEIMWEEHEDLSEQEIEAMITPKEQLRAFETHGPDASEAQTGETTNG
ncbi:MAG TPA: DUF4288 domain-containing protein [Acidobacteriaceae bacterium]|jgi:hypothetical protein